MRFEPFDTGLIVQHLRQQVPELHFVGGAADYAAVRELASFRTPSAYVVFAEEENTGKFPATPQVCFQGSSAKFGVVLALRNYQEQLGGQMGEEARKLIVHPLHVTFNRSAAPLALVGKPANRPS